MNYSRVLGIDVSKKRLDCAFFPHTQDGAFSLENDEAGATALLARLSALQPAVVALEASGGCERLIVGGVGILDPLLIAQPGVFRSDRGVIQSGADAVRELNLSELILKQERSGSLQHAE